jgi:hypothetical protein
MSLEIVFCLKMLLVMNADRPPESLHTNKDCAPGNSIADKSDRRTHGGRAKERIGSGSEVHGSMVKSVAKELN